MSIESNSICNSVDKDEQAEKQWQDCIDDESAKKKGFKNKAEMEYYNDPDKQMVWVKLSNTNVEGKTEKKGRFSYVSWAWAWAFVKTYFPDVSFRYIDNKDGLNYHHDNNYAWVKVGVTINKIEHIEQLPVLNNSNRPIPLSKINSFDVNTALKRCKVKAIALHGLGIQLYAGEDLPLEVAEDQREHKKEALKKSVSEANKYIERKKQQKPIASFGKASEKQINLLKRNLEKFKDEDITKINSGDLTTKEASVLIGSLWSNS